MKIKNEKNMFCESITDRFGNYSPMLALDFARAKGRHCMCKDGYLYLSYTNKSWYAQTKLPSGLAKRWEGKMLF
jgi:hypothetical protein